MIKTVFGEEIKVNDNIMYINKQYGSMILSFGKVIDLGVYKHPYHIHPSTRLHVHKTFEMCDNKDHCKKCDKMVILTNPTAFKCGVPIPRMYSHTKDALCKE